MSVWIYQNKSENVKNSIVKSEFCIFCSSEG